MLYSNMPREFRYQISPPAARDSNCVICNTRPLVGHAGLPSGSHWWWRPTPRQTSRAPPHASSAARRERGPEADAPRARGSQPPRLRRQREPRFLADRERVARYPQRALRPLSPSGGRYSLRSTCSAHTGDYTRTFNHRGGRARRPPARNSHWTLALGEGEGTAASSSRRQSRAPRRDLLKHRRAASARLREEFASLLYSGARSRRGSHRVFGPTSDAATQKDTVQGSSC